MHGTRKEVFVVGQAAWPASGFEMEKDDNGNVGIRSVSTMVGKIVHLKTTYYSMHMLFDIPTCDIGHSIGSPIPSSGEWHQ
ncbi:hypothetical protein LIER_05097 [Lithospermum erythrorhizon]|uniref:Uncharacterized protein n=1 Tax=Lithospermum erythrorhizon TaxID=34254 RepID=A0AAV3P1Y4_LITER